MAEWIGEQITAHLVAALDGVAMYGGTTTARRERLAMVVNDRYPFIEVAGPMGEIDTEQYQLGQHTLTYAVKYYVNVNDEDLDANTEITYLTRNIVADIIKAVNVDQTRGKLAQNTRATDYGYDFELVGDSIQFFVYVIFDVIALIDTKDPYELG